MSDRLRIAAEAALEALETCVCAMQDYQAGIGITEMFDVGERKGRETLIALRAALVEPTSPRREWVGLKDEAIADIVDDMNGNEPTAPFWRDLARAIEAALKEKNT